MNKPIIAIFVAGNLSTPDEEKLIEKYQSYPHVILNAETFDRHTSLVADAVIGVVPEHLKHLPQPDKVIEDWKKVVGKVAEPVGGTPPKATDTPPQDQPKADSGNAQGGFGTPPKATDTPPKK